MCVDCPVSRGSFGLGKSLCGPMSQPRTCLYQHSGTRGSKCPESLRYVSERPDCAFTGKYKSEFACYVAHSKRKETLDFVEGF